jgi:predicted RNase H-like nuclease (RuvC/YqgF family)
VSLKPNERHELQVYLTRVCPNDPESLARFHQECTPERIQALLDHGDKETISSLKEKIEDLESVISELEDEVSSLEYNLEDAVDERDALRTLKLDSK